MSALYPEIETVGGPWGLLLRFNPMVLASVECQSCYRRVPADQTSMQPHPREICKLSVTTCFECVPPDDFLHGRPIFFQKEG